MLCLIFFLSEKSSVFLDSLLENDHQGGGVGIKVDYLSVGLIVTEVVHNEGQGFLIWAKWAAAQGTEGEVRPGRHTSLDRR